MSTLATRTRRIASEYGWNRGSRHYSQQSTTASVGADQENPTWKSEVDPPNWLRLRFRLYTNRKVGTILGLVGNLQELGMWSIDRKLVFSHRRGEYPYWSSDELLIPLQQRSLSVEYKYVFVDSVRCI